MIAAVSVFVAAIGVALIFGTPHDAGAQGTPLDISPAAFADHGHVETAVLPPPAVREIPFESAAPAPVIYLAPPLPPHRPDAQVIEEPQLIPIPMNVSPEVRRRVECANGRVASCDGIRGRRLP